MTCAFAHDDAAYVLGALVLVERLAFEKHLPDCDRCTRAVRELAGLPGLLGRVDAGVLADLADEQPVPGTLLPAMSREVRRARRQRTVVATALVAAAAVLAVAMVVLQTTRDGDLGTQDAPTAIPDEAPVVAGTMDPVGDVPVRASLTLEQVTWGTRIGLTCTYDPESVDYELPPAVDYTLFVRTRDGRAERLGSWRGVGGRTMQLSAASAASLADIVSVEVRAPGGRVVLMLTT